MKREPLPPGTTALVVSDLLNTVGTGLFLTGGTLFLNRAAGLSVLQTSLVLTVAGVVGMCAGPLLGALADRVGPRRITVAVLVLRAAAVLWLSAVHGVAGVVVPVTISLVCQGGLQATFGALTAAVGGNQKVRVQGVLRTVTNVGVTVGTLAAAPALAIGTANAYRTLMVANALMLLIAGLSLLRAAAPDVTVPKKERVSMLHALRNRPYTTVAALQGLLGFNYDVISFALPLWVALHTQAPRWLISACITVNTAVVILFQMKAVKAAGTVHEHARLARRAGFIFVVSTAMIGITAHTPTALTIVLLFAGVAVHSVGEIWQAASVFSLSFDLAPEGAHGQYQGVFALGRGMTRALAPSLLGLLCLNLTTPGWILLGVLLAAAGVAVVPAADWALREHGRPSSCSMTSPQSVGTH